MPLAELYRQGYWAQWKVQPLMHPDSELIRQTALLQLLLRIIVHPYMWLCMYHYVIGPRMDDIMPSVGETTGLLFVSFYGFFALNAVAHRAMHEYPVL